MLEQYFEWMKLMIEDYRGIFPRIVKLDFTDRSIILIESLFIKDVKLASFFIKGRVLFWFKRC